MKGEAWRFLSVYAKKRTPQQRYRRNCAGLCGTANPQLAMKLGIQMHLTGLSLSNSASVLILLGVQKSIISRTYENLRRVERALSTFHNHIYNIDLQLGEDINPGSAT